MKFLLLMSILFLVGCQVQWGSNPSSAASEKQSRFRIAPGVDKFVDGDNTCYVYSAYGISCVKTGSPK